jgi:t-SNARE complex subunit (syntaxin)
MVWDPQRQQALRMYGIIIIVIFVVVVVMERNNLKNKNG